MAVSLGAGLQCRPQLPGAQRATTVLPTTRWRPALEPFLRPVGREVLAASSCPFADTDNAAAPTAHALVENLPLPEGNWAPLPFVGETPAYLEDPRQFTFDRVKKYGPVFRSHLFGMPVIVLADMHGLETALNGTHRLTEWCTAPSMSALMGEDLVAPMARKEPHMKSRRHTAAGMTPEALDSYLPRTVALCASALEAWAVQGRINLLEEVDKLSFDFSDQLVVGLGVTGKTKEQLREKWTLFSRNLMTFKLDLPGTPFNTARRALDYLLSAISPTAKARLTDWRAGRGGKPDTMMHWWTLARLADGENSSADLFARQVVFFMLAGYDTSRNSHKVLLGILPQLPAGTMDKLRKEQAQLVARYGPMITRRVLNASVYADAVTREVLRMRGPADMVFRQAKVDFALHGKRIPAGSNLVIDMMYAKNSDARVSSGDHTTTSVPAHMDIHRLDASFRPERWLDSSVGLDNTALTTFGSGTHFCLGFPLYMMEAKVLLALIARGYNVELLSGTTDWGVSPNHKGGSPVGDIILSFKPRSEAQQPSAGVPALACN